MKLANKRICATFLVVLTLCSLLLSLTACGKNANDEARGLDGKTPFIGGNGNWWIGDIDTGVCAVAHDGLPGADGVAGADGKNGVDGKDGLNGKDGTNGKDGVDGISVVSFNLDDDGNLIVNYSNDTSQNLGKFVPEDGKDAIAPQIKIENNYWKISTDGGNTWTNTGVKAAGIDGRDGTAPQLRINNDTKQWEYWNINTNEWDDLGCSALGPKGDTGDTGITPKFRVVDGKWYVSYDKGQNWEYLTDAAPEIGNTGNGITPRISINPTTYEWEVSYDDGETWTSLGVVAKGTDGADGTAPEIRINGETKQWQYYDNRIEAWVDFGVSAQGMKGDPGADGRGIAKMEIIDGSLWVTYTDSTTPVEIGKISSIAARDLELTFDYTDGLEFYMMKYVDPDGVTPATAEYVYGVAVGTAKYMDHIVIPATYNGKRVTVVIENAFYCVGGVTNIESITVPEGIEEIRDNAFAGLTGATVMLPSTVETIREHAFSGVAKVVVNMSEAEFRAKGWSADFLGCAEVEFLK